MGQDDICSGGGSGYPSDCELTEVLLEKARKRQESPEKGYVWKSCLPRAKGLKLFLLDVDGVLTDGTITYTHEGNEIIFNDLNELLSRGQAPQHLLA